MGQSVDFRVVFGVMVDSEEHPWYDEDDEGDHEDWWRRSQGFEPSFCPFNESGGYAEGVMEDDARIGEYFDERKEWEAKHPRPFDVEYSSSYDYGDRFICAPKTKTYWDPVELAEVTEFATLDDSTEAAFREFLAKHFPGAAEPKWMILPFYG